jgi:hypothetical protein
MNMAPKLRVPLKAENLTSYAIISFSRTVLHRVVYLPVHVF